MPQVFQPGPFLSLCKGTGGRPGRAPEAEEAPTALPRSQRAAASLTRAMGSLVSQNRDPFPPAIRIPSLLSQGSRRPAIELYELHFPSALAPWRRKRRFSRWVLFRSDWLSGAAPCGYWLRRSHDAPGDVLPHGSRAAAVGRGGMWPGCCRGRSR